jgi:aromatic ring-opening dioxygenase catalytic subunit (LigB family)
MEKKFKSPVLFIPHGGGPMPLLGDEGHKKLVTFLKNIPAELGKPKAIILISAHWEESVPTITSGSAPKLIYDYFGFPEESYQIQYPSPGAPDLAEKVFQEFQKNGIDAKLNSKRGFDHGMFVPLKLMYPEANIPCIQISLVRSLDPKIHLQMGKALANLRDENILFIGSGFSFHNLREFFTPQPNGIDSKNTAFEKWLIETCTDPEIYFSEGEKRLTNWLNASFARYCHPREEHLLPLHVCFGLSDAPAKLVFQDKVLGKLTSSFLW